MKISLKKIHFSKTIQAELERKINCSIRKKSIKFQSGQKTFSLWYFSNLPFTLSTHFEFICNQSFSLVGWKQDSTPRLICSLRDIPSFSSSFSLEIFLPLLFSSPLTVSWFQALSILKFFYSSLLIQTINCP